MGSTLYISVLARPGVLCWAIARLLRTADRNSNSCLSRCSIIFLCIIVRNTVIFYVQMSQHEHVLKLTIDGRPYVSETPTVLSFVPYDVEREYQVDCAEQQSRAELTLVWSKKLTVAVLDGRHRLDTRNRAFVFSHRVNSAPRSSKHRRLILSYYCN